MSNPSDPWMDPAFTKRVKTGSWTSAVLASMKSGSCFGWAKFRKPAGSSRCVYTLPGDIEDHGWLTHSIGFDPGYDGNNGWYEAMRSGWVRFIVEPNIGGGDPKKLGTVFLSGIRSEDVEGLYHSMPGGAKWYPIAVKHDLDGGGVKELLLDMRRPNPPRDIDSDDVLGGECAVWALAAASGRSVPDVRRAFMEEGIDIWTSDGMATGTSLERIRKMVKKLDLEKRIVYIGYSYPMLQREPSRHMVSKDYTSRFMYGVSADEFARTQAAKEGFELPEGHTSGASRATVGQVIRYARKNGYAALAVTAKLRTYVKTERVVGGGSRRVRHIAGSTHIVGYSPSSGVFDTAAHIPYDKAMSRNRETGQWLKGGDWHRHGQDIPDPSRGALLWVYFKGE